MSRVVAGGPTGLVDHQFRHDSGRIVAALARRFGLSSLPEVEDAVQEAFRVALLSWSLRELPADPAGWIYRVALNVLLDRQRRAGAWERAQDRGAGDLEVAETPGVGFDQEIGDELLRMLFVACDPSIPAGSKLVFALKVLCGFNTREIALRLFLSEDNVQKRLERARHALATAGVDLDTPVDLDARLASVHHVLYLLFNEGYGAARGDVLVRRELCEEAIRLAQVLVEHPAGQRAETHALLALFHFHAARLGERVDAAGELLTLAKQDRSAWDREHIRQGVAWLEVAAQGEVFGRYHAEAGIAAEHCLAPSFAETRWPVIAELYSLRDRVAPSPLNALNRAVAIAEFQGAEAALDSLEGVRLLPGMAGYYLWDAVVGDLWLRAGDRARAVPYLERAAVAAPTEAERAHLRRRLLEAKDGPPGGPTPSAPAGRGRRGSTGRG